MRLGRLSIRKNPGEPYLRWGYIRDEFDWGDERGSHLFRVSIAAFGLLFSWAVT